jgi:hypothetical protein
MHECPWIVGLDHHCDLPQFAKIHRKIDEKFHLQPLTI